jgi:hypothetical protein
MSHQVNFEIPKRRLQNSDIEFHVRKDGKAFGTLKVSKGAIVWFPRSKQVGRKLSWRRFDSLMEEEARRAERR